MEEEEILDRDAKQTVTAAIWPYILVGGAVAGAVKVAFTIMAPLSGLTLQAILLVLVSMIMMNSTLNFYYQKKHAAKDVRTAILLCAGIYVLMQILSRMILFLMGRYPNEFVEFWGADLAISLAAGALISVVVGVLSRKAD